MRHVLQGGTPRLSTSRIHNFVTALVNSFTMHLVTLVWSMLIPQSRRCLGGNAEYLVRGGGAEIFVCLQIPVFGLAPAHRCIGQTVEMRADSMASSVSP